MNLTVCSQTTENKYKTGQMRASFILFSSLSSKEDQFKENMNLLIQDLTGHNLYLDKYVEISEGQINTIIADGEISESKILRPMLQKFVTFVSNKKKKS